LPWGANRVFVLLVVLGDGLKQRRRIGYGMRDGTNGVKAVRGRKNSTHAHASVRRAHADKSEPASRPPNRNAGIGAKTAETKP